MNVIACAPLAGTTAPSSNRPMLRRCVLVLRHLAQIDGVLGFAKTVRGREKLAVADPLLVVGDLLEARDLESLPVLDDLDELGCFQQRIRRAGVEPGDAAAE